MKKKHNILNDAVQLLTSTGAAIATAGSNPSHLDPFWFSSNESNDSRIDNSLWQSVLDSYLCVAEKPLGVNLFDYHRFQQDKNTALDEYLAMLISIDPRDLNCAEQMCYWINLYNALTIQLVARHFPVTSITRISATVGSFGPWSDHIVTLQGQSLSLDHIEHRILRPVFNDHRIHFAVNCASMGCPDLAPQAYHRGNYQQLLEHGARLFVSHPRAIRFENEQLCLSSIFEWYESDFGDDLPSALNTLAGYAHPELAGRLTQYKGFAKYDYDWALNAVQA